ncbi:hypothetical protein J6590_002860 [Homalodisca vitripennis]|nr:hypothetical protein J6590_002860 [Homalodisca vitripennis]
MPQGSYSKAKPLLYAPFFLQRFDHVHYFRLEEPLQDPGGSSCFFCNQQDFVCKLVRVSDHAPLEYHITGKEMVNARQVVDQRAFLPANRCLDQYIHTNTLNIEHGPLGISLDIYAVTVCRLIRVFAGKRFF